MFGSAVIDTAIGIILLFFVVSTICSTAYSLIARMLNTRGQMLNESLERLLGPDIYEKLMHHPLIYENHLKLKRAGFTRILEMEYQTLPDYIDPDTFARVLTEILEKAANSSDLTRYLPDELTPPIEYFLEEIQEKQKTFMAVKVEVEQWFDQRMTILSRLFKERAQWWLMGIALAVTLIFNINTILIAQALWQGPTLRDAVVAAADTQIERVTDASLVGEGEDLRPPAQIFEEELVALNLPVGWTAQELDAIIFPESLAQVDDPTRPVPHWFTNLIGWMVTVAAAMFGAPFWFDLLRKVVSIRSKE